MSLESMPSKPPSPELAADSEFAQHSLRLLADQLKTHCHEGYPSMAHRLRGVTSTLVESGQVKLNLDDSWNVGQIVPTDEEASQNLNMPYGVDWFDRPRHPWYYKMVNDTRIGAVLGKGFFREWGPNQTADAVVIRSGHVLLVEREDCGMWALTGGFVDEEDGGLTAVAAAREVGEEADCDLNDCPPPVLLYSGPVADIRMTANAWPETEAWLFDLGDGPLPPVRGRDDAKQADWVPLDEARGMPLYGSHSLLLEEAIQRL